jgi:acetylornithine deacetylase
MPTDPVIALLSDLVAIDSVNPALVPGANGEAAVAAAIAGVCRAAGFAVTVEEVAPGRPNVVAVLEGARPGRTLMLCGHTDTVGVAGVSAPFSPVVKDGRLYGRGSQDMKAGVAAMIDAARIVASGAGLASGRLVLACVADEEHASLGADALVRSWRADAAVVTEPTDLVIGVAHKGFAWLEVAVGGVAAHGSRPADGRDAILRAGRILAALEALDRELQRKPAHPRLGTASLHASTIAGGHEWSTYPDRCLLQYERRTLPAEPNSAALHEAEGILDAIRRVDPDVVARARVVFARSAYEIDERAEIAQALSSSCQAAGRTGKFGGVSYWTDAQVLGHAGIPTVIFGPGGAGLHSTEEYVKVDEVIACRNVLVDLARRFLG